MKNKNEVILKDTIDRRSWQTLLNNSPPLKEKSRASPLHQGFLADLHTSLLKPSPIVKPDNEIYPSHLAVKSIIEEMLKTSDYKTLHAITKNDSLGAGLGTLSLAYLLNELKQFPDFSLQIKQIEQLEELAQTLKELNQPHQKHLKKAQKIKNQLPIKKLHQEVATTKDSLRIAARKACKHAQQEVQESMEGISSWGFEPGKPVTLDLSKSLNLARELMNDPKLKKIAKLAGRIRTIALNKRETKAHRACEEVVDVELGNNLSQVIPSEFLMPDFVKRFCEGNLMQRKLEGKEKLGKGPIICCMDESGSMAGEREIWAKAYFLGLQVLASKDKRDISYVTFGTSVSKCEIFPKGKIDPMQLCELMSCFQGHGGTAFDPPLLKALGIRKNNKSDIVFITDGKSHISTYVKENILKAKKKGLHLYVVLIGSSSNGIFDGIADEIVEITPSEDYMALSIYEKL